MRENKIFAHLPLELETELSLAEVLCMANRGAAKVEFFEFKDEENLPESFYEIEVSRCRFINCHFSQLSFDKAWLHNVIFEKCDFTKADLIGASLHECEFNGCRLTGAQIYNSSIKNVLFTGCTAEYCNFSDTLIKDTLFKDSVFKSAIFNSARFGGTRFSEVNLNCAEWQDTFLKGIDLTTCEIDGGMFGFNALKGAIVTPPQACELAKLLGVIIK